MPLYGQGSYGQGLYGGGASASLSPSVIAETPADILRKHVPPSMKGDVWTQLLATLGEEEKSAQDQSEAVYDQLFLATADGAYLDARASEEGGYLRPELVGFSDDAFRELVIQLSTRKLTINTFLALLEIYYGIDAVRAHITSTTTETFNIVDGSQQTFIIDGVPGFTVTFHASDFETSGAVTATEAAVALNRQFELIGAKALALPFLDTQTDQTYLTVYSASRGLRGSMESVSGPIPFPAGRQTLQTQVRAAYVKVTGGETVIVLPSTSIVVSRTPNVDAAYLNGVALDINTASADSVTGIVTLQTVGPHGLSPGQSIIVDGLMYPPAAGAFGENVWPVPENAESSYYDNNEHVAVISDAILAPNGVLSADKITEADTLNAVHSLSRNAVNFPAGTGVVHTFSCYIKAAERPKVDLTIGNLYALLDATDGTFSNVAPAVQAISSVNAGGGWWRFILTGIPSSASFFFVLQNGTTIVYPGVVGNGVYLWGIKLEAGSVATPYFYESTAVARGLNGLFKVLTTPSGDVLTY